MDYQALDHKIEMLKHSIPEVSSIMFAVRIHDWAPLFAEAREIQQAFKDRVQYPSKHDREAAWVRFNDTRTLLFERANAERARFREESASLRNDILAHVRYASYNRLADVVFFFDPTTVADMKAKSLIIKEGGEMLSRYKQRMLKEHKDECFEKFQELRRTHDAFWGEYRQHNENKRAEFAQRRSEIVAKIEINIRSNGEKLAKASAAYDRVEANLAANIEKLSDARSENFAERVSGWIAEDKEKLRSISETIDRMRGWINEDKIRLNDIQARG